MKSIFHVTVSILMLIGNISLTSCCVEPKSKNLSLSSIDGYEGRDGKTEALADIKAGTPKYKNYGMPHPAIGVYSKILMNKTGIKVDRIAFCDVDKPLLNYASSYNKVIEAYAEKKFGVGIFGQLWDEALIEYAQQKKQAAN